MPSPIPAHLTGAIIAYLRGAGAWAAEVVGGVRSADAPRDHPMPYVIVELVDSATLRIFGGRAIDTRTMVLTLYAARRDDAERLGLALRDLLIPTAGFTPPALLFAEGLDVNRGPAGGESIGIDPERGPISPGVDTWSYRLPITWTVSR